MRIEQIAAKRGYVVDEDGNFYNPQGDQIGSVNDNGYLQTKIRVDTVNTKLICHRLQAFQKFGMKLFNEGIEVRHLNGIRADNSWDNIQIGTHSENMMDIPENIRIKRALHATSFARKHDKESIRNYHEKHGSYKKTMAEFGISSKGTLHFILNK